MGETKVIYHLDEEETPYLVKVPVPAADIRLRDFKAALGRGHAKYFFKAMDQDFGVVKEEISDDNAKLPCFNGRVVSWLVSAEATPPEQAPPPPPAEVRPEAPPLPPPLPPPPAERTSGIGDSRPPSFHPHVSDSAENLDQETETESVVSTRRERPRRRESGDPAVGRPVNGRSDRHLSGYESSSTLLTSEIETSICDSEEDDTMSRFSSSTEQSSASRLLKRHRRRRKQRPPRLDRASSLSSVTDSTMSLNIITVTLNMEKYNFLGISIVGQSNERGDGGIYIGSIMKGGAVAADGRIEPGDMLLQVNDINFENMSNDDAVRVLQDIVHKPGPIVLTVAKCWDPSPQGYFTLPRNEPIQPIDPAAWVSHSAAMSGSFPVYPGSASMSSMTSSTSVTETELSHALPPVSLFSLSIHTDLASVVKVMASPESGLEVRDRMWLKITIPNAFLGSDVVDWLYHHVEGFQDRREARKFASNLLKAGFIRHTVNKITFSEQCYYIFGDLSSCENWSRSSGSTRSDGGRGVQKEDRSAGGGDSKSGSGSESEYSTRSSLRRSGDAGPPSERSASIRSHHPPSVHSYPAPGVPLSYNPMMLMMMPPPLPPPSACPPSSSVPPGAPPLVRDLASVPPELTASRQSFHMAMGNPSEFFVDVM
ncbi:segment polarity protein dishevelled homolog DVL-2 isoform X2 [Engystomops pustulosus]|uniref:segment polarity protein dishevelled homolog DVL-2 isoform X2 n=1 Tax=Engystomops pustulosus TaxID=76066 RepID=UPI003AFB7DBE